MDELRDELKESCLARIQYFDEMAPGDDGFDDAKKAVLDIYDRLLKTEELEQKAAEMNDQKVLEAERLEQQKIDSKRNAIMKAVGMGVSSAFTIAILNFEKFGTFTTQVGRGFLNGIIKNFKIGV